MKSVKAGLMPVSTREHNEMSMTDPIADMLTRIRNANIARHDRVEIPASRQKEEIARILQEEGYIRNYRYLEDRRQGILRVYLKYSKDRERVISNIRRISKPGRRVYVGKSDLPKVLNGLGIAILSTPRGVMTAAQCKRENVGGEMLCYVW
jgi:small subunit ribosomal protein S8